jgi:DNA mismatch repair ATPase MutS
MEKQYPGKVVNNSFEVVIENDLLVFDYKLKEGVARQMNATFLMKKMGITD